MSTLLESRTEPEKIQISTDSSELPQTSAPEASNTSRLEDLELTRDYELKRENIMPTQLLERYVDLALNRSLAETMENGEYFVTVPLLKGVWATGNTIESAEADLRATIFEWLSLKIEGQDGDIPEIESINLNWL
jgi:predicted RNase H-like HicB family nuclease